MTRKLQALQSTMHPNNFERAIKTGNRFMSFRPRSESEVRGRLLKNFSPDLVDKTINYLKLQNKINDSLFVKFWVEKRTHSTSRSSNFVRKELINKGITPEIIDPAIEKIDDERVAYLSAQKTVKNFKPTDYISFMNRIIRSLTYRGFDNYLSSKVAKQLWKEKTNIIAEPCDMRN